MEAAKKRPDPRPRKHVPGLSGTVINTRPDRKYLLAYPNDPVTGLAGHLDNGWHRVNHREDKERIHSGSLDPNGDVTFQGMILIYIEKDIWDEIQEDKQAVLRAREAKSRGPGGIDNLMDVEGNPASNI
jgi:hypothetical protein